jgi:hypothetical protein
MKEWHINNRLGMTQKEGITFYFKSIYRIRDIMLQ